MAGTAVVVGRAPISRRVWLAYGLPALALVGPFNYVQFYFLNFATDVLLLAPAAVGALLAGARAWTPSRTRWPGT